MLAAGEIVWSSSDLPEQARHAADEAFRSTNNPPEQPSQVFQKAKDAPFSQEKTLLISGVAQRQKKYIIATTEETHEPGAAAKAPYLLLRGVEGAISDGFMP